ncbi:STM3941 family protein [Bradyrhizobium sp. Arg314]
MPFDTNRTVEFRSSPARLGLGAILLAVMGTLCLALGWPLLPDIAPTSFEQILGWTGAILSAATFVIVVVRLFDLNRPTLILSPTGFWDVRLSAEFIPWSAVKRISERSYRRQTFLLVEVLESVWQSSSLTKLARWSRGPNRMMGLDAMCIGTGDLDVKYDELSSMITAYARAYGVKVD